MAPRKKAYSKLSVSGKYYRDNAAARKKKAKTDKKVNAKPAQKKKRVEAGAARRKAKKAGKNIQGKDYDHGSRRFINSSKNRGKKSGTAGDKRARGSKRRA